MAHRRTPSLATLTADLLCVLAAVWLGCMADSWHHDRDVAVLVGRLSLYMLFWILLTERLGTYQQSPRLRHGQALRSVGEAWVLTAALGGLVDATLLDVPADNVWRSFGSGLLLLLIARLVVQRFLGDSTQNLRPRVLLLGSSDKAACLVAGREARRRHDLRGHLAFPGEPDCNLPELQTLGDFGQLETLITEHDIELVVICPSDKAVTGDINRAFQVCDRLGMAVRFFPSFLELQHLRSLLTRVDGSVVLEMQRNPERAIAMLVKRVVDFFGAALGIFLLLPVFVTAALAVKLTSKGPILFAQLRVGKNGELFRCLKFRTMKVGAQQMQNQLQQNSIQDGPAFKIPNDPRLTPVGGLLRRYSLDELPQLFNVLLGDMSIVGPRPPIPSEVDRYSWWQRRRISVKPGLTCIWQVWGRNRVSFKRWVEMDLFYIDNWSLWLDFKLIVHTVGAVVRGTGM
jgi:exopolysaccharide biosynthesis polyprenyl glycosylphosphotransferase